MHMATSCHICATCSLPNPITADWIRCAHLTQLSQSDYLLGIWTYVWKRVKSDLLAVKMSCCELTPKLRYGFFIWNNGERGSARWEKLGQWADRCRHKETKSHQGSHWLLWSPLHSTQKAQTWVLVNFLSGLKRLKMVLISCISCYLKKSRLR